MQQGPSQPNTSLFIDTRIVKPNHPPKKSAVKSTPSVNLEPKLAKTFMPQKMARSTSNTLDSFYKRMVNVTSSASTSSEPQRGEATKESIAKMKRAAVDGKATMKRAGSFTKSALSPRRPKRTVSMLSQAPQETGTVILRRDNSIPNPETTPRTSLNRYLGTNLFADYSEACPVSRTYQMIQMSMLISPCIVAHIKNIAYISSNKFSLCAIRIPSGAQNTPRHFISLQKDHDG